MKIKSISYALMISAVAIALCSFAIADNWVEIGSRKVNFGLDRDVINVSYRDGYFEAIKIVVRGGALNMHKCTVYFENGGQQEIELRHNFGKGTDSRVIDLKGNKRFIDKIEFWYDTKNAANRKAEVIVWGRK
ncbi:DUF2541 family protein [Ohtaekwangia sp.]|uniref:DUF2541 family protein n=1 Tax=Ohtaekwangia sp. TaxID=2066019 RepID=UPI002F9431CD